MKLDHAFGLAGENVRVGLYFVLSALFLAGCALTPPPPITAQLPTVALQANVEQSQEKEGIAITVTTATYAAVKKERYSIKRLSTVSIMDVSRDLAATGITPGLMPIEETFTPYLDIEPGRLLFAVRVGNKTTQAFQFKGMQIQLKIDGKSIPAARIDSSAFDSAVVQPGFESTFNIYGPKLTSLPEKGTIVISILDVPSTVDSADKTMEKQSYEWSFDYSAQLASDVGMPRVINRYADSVEIADCLEIAKKQKKANADQ